MSVVVQTPNAADALFDAFVGVAFNDPDAFAAHDPYMVSGEFFLKPVQDELLNLIALQLEGGGSVRVRNQSGGAFAAGDLVYFSGALGVDEQGDTATQLSSWVLNGATVRNTRNGRLYWKLTDTGGDRTVTLYRDTTGDSTQAVASGTRTGDGSITLTQQNSSGISGTVTVAYTADDTDLASNILTLNLLLVSLADADDEEKAPMAVLDAALGNNANGVAYGARQITGIDTSAAGAVGDPVYLSGTATTGNTWTFTAPTGGNQAVIEVGRVVQDDATNGIIAFYPANRMLRKVGTDWIQAAIAPTWSGIHTFSAAPVFSAGIVLTESSAPSLSTNQVSAYASNIVTADNEGWVLQGEQAGAKFVFSGLVGSISVSAFYMGNITPSATNWALICDGTYTSLNAPSTSGLFLRLGASVFAGLGASGFRIGSDVPGSGANVFMISAGSAWTPVADAAACYVTDYSGAGTATWHFQNEPGHTIKLYTAAALTTALTTVTHTAPGTPDYAIAALVDSGVGSAWGFSTQDEGHTVLSVIANLQARVNELEARQQAQGFGA